MTATFAAGQIAGPFTVSLFAGRSNTFAITRLMAATALVFGNWALWRTTSTSISLQMQERNPRDALPCTSQ